MGICTSVFFWDSFPDEEHEGNTWSNVAYPLASFLILYGPKSTAISLGVAIPGTVSSLYHTYLENGHDITTLNVALAFDYAAVIAGVTLALVLNDPIPYPSASTIVAIVVAALACIMMFSLDKRLRYIIHDAWHFLSVLPAILYAFVDVGDTRENHGDDIEMAALFMSIACTLAFLLSVAYHRNREDGGYILFNNLHY